MKTKWMMIAAVIAVAGIGIGTMTWRARALGGPTWGMMGNWTPGTTNSYGCHQFRSTTTYEWWYLHLDSEDQELADQLLIEAMMDVDWTSLTATEKNSALADIQSDIQATINALNEEGTNE